MCVMRGDQECKSKAGTAQGAQEPEKKGTNVTNPFITEKMACHAPAHSDDQTLARRTHPAKRGGRVGGEGQELLHRKERRAEPSDVVQS